MSFTGKNRKVLCEKLECLGYPNKNLLYRLSYKGRTEDALALGADEGRDEHRYASGSCK
jgi:hypothetical protein